MTTPAAVMIVAKNVSTPSLSTGGTLYRLATVLADGPLGRRTALLLGSSRPHRERARPDPMAAVVRATTAAAVKAAENPEASSAPLARPPVPTPTRTKA